MVLAMVVVELVALDGDFAENFVLVVNGSLLVDQVEREVAEAARDFELELFAIERTNRQEQSASTRTAAIIRTHLSVFSATDVLKINSESRLIVTYTSRSPEPFLGVMFLASPAITQRR